MMGRHDDTDERIRAYFGARLARYGDDPRGVDWQSTEAQRARFEALVDRVDLAGASILDAGCGLGHLYGYLDERNLVARYTGCDLSAAHVDGARRAYPTGRFIVGDARDVARHERFDVVLACGLLHLRVPRWQRWAWDLVRSLYAGCDRTLAFTLPRRGAGHPPILATVEPADWLARLRTLSPTAQAYSLEPWGDVVYVVASDQ